MRLRLRLWVVSCRRVAAADAAAVLLKLLLVLVVFCCWTHVEIQSELGSSKAVCKVPHALIFSRQYRKYLDARALSHRGLPVVLVPVPPQGPLRLNRRPSAWLRRIHVR